MFGMAVVRAMEMIPSCYSASLFIDDKCPRCGREGCECDPDNCDCEQVEESTNDDA